jgi:hypothetical protein
MSFENDLHDWYIDGIMVTPSEITLLLHFYETRKKIRLGGVTWCSLNDLFTQNIIYEAKIVSADEQPDLYWAEVVQLQASGPVNVWGRAPNIMTISASLGLEGAIEFRDLEVTDL